jgi:ribose-phosphate pyrophosphokinase
MHRVDSTPLVFSIRTYDYMRDELARSLSASVGGIERQTFPDGEHYMRLETPVLGRRVVLIGGTGSDSETLELYDLASAIVKYGARSLSLVVPYFGYATMERATKTGEVVTAKNRARLLSSIPNGDAPNRVFLFDAHTEGLPYYFEGSTVPVHVYGKSIVTRLVDEMAGTRADLVLACTDAGRAKWVQSLANDMGVFASFVFKRRLSGDETAVTAVSAQVEDKHVVIYDDMIRTGGSLLQAAKAYRDAGAREISAVATHGLFPGESLKKIEQSGLLRSLACTDSVPRARTLASKFLRVAPSAEVFASVLREHL